ncbi:hypothetical protein [Diplocloster modestus]|uniref:Uncharacterized protein n=1 Tax=Diplocloster modestus TaxID=2850322 RepID=A0ABS6KE21_9FIRM|nr:hypothetical protein [Diplocloster modestus]MBU9728775.1 hypothetical protein [Diplocloster modestus]
MRCEKRLELLRITLDNVDKNKRHQQESIGVLVGKDPFRCGLRYKENEVTVHGI